MLTQQEAALLLQEANTIVTAATPLFGPSAPAVLLALQVAEKAAPAVYAEILALLKKGETTDDENAYVRELIEGLKHPEKDY